MCLIRTLQVTRDAAEGAVVAEVAVAEAVEVVVVAEAGEEVHQPLLHRSLSNQVIWGCGKPGHSSNQCPDKIEYPTKTVHFSDTDVFYTSIQTFHPAEEDFTPLISTIETVFLSSTSGLSDTTVRLDTQAAIHLISNPALLSDITESVRPIMVQGITRGKAQATQHGTITTLSVQAYDSPQMAANILSCNLLHDTHKIQYHYKSNAFTQWVRGSYFRVFGNTIF
jgi:hypothetical protein